jgi:hypothetical protein
MDTNTHSLVVSKIQQNQGFVNLGHRIRARIFKPFKEPKNRFPAWQNRFLGIDCWAA